MNSSYPSKQGLITEADFESCKKKISNPLTFGPGIWYCIHMNAKDAKTEVGKQKFKDFIENTITALPCTTCIQHASDYYQKHPLKDYWHIKENGQDIGMFRWAWQFHNTVNQRLQKPIVNWENAKMLYSDETGVCTSDCGKEQVSVVFSAPVVSSASVISSSPVVSSSRVTNNNYSFVSSAPVSMIREDPLQRFIPKNIIIRPNSIEKTKSNRFRNV